MLLTDFKVTWLRRILVPQMVPLTERLQANTDANVHALTGSWYFSASFMYQYSCFCMHIISTFCSCADTVSSDNCFNESNVITLNVPILILFSYQRIFLKSSAGFLNNVICLPALTECVINRGHLYGWSVVVFLLNYLFLAVDQWDNNAHNQVKGTFGSILLASHLPCSVPCFHVCE